MEDIKLAMDLYCRHYNLQHILASSSPCLPILPIQDVSRGA
jgi:hypothetical protein